MEILFYCFYSVAICVLTLKMLGFYFTSCLLFYSTNNNKARSQSNVSGTAKERVGPTSFSRVRT